MSRILRLAVPVILWGSETPLDIYRNTVIDTLSPNFYLVPEENGGNEFRDLIGLTNNIGTNTSYGGVISSPTTNTIDGEPFITFNGTTSIIDALNESLFSGALPSKLSLLFRIKLDSWTTANQYLFSMRTDGNNDYRLFLGGSGSIFHRQIAGGTTTTIIAPALSAGWHQLIAVYDGANTSMEWFVDGVSIDTASPAAAPSGASILTSVIGAFSTTPSLMMDGDVSEIAVSTTVAIDSTQAAALYNALG